MKNKTGELYDAVLNHVKLLCKNSFQLEYVVCDLEQGLRKSVTKAFPNVQLLLCGVHVVRAFERRLKTNSLWKKIKSKKNGNHMLTFWRTLKGLRFTPLDNPYVSQCLNEWLDYCLNHVPNDVQKSDFTDFVNYLRTNYLNPDAKIAKISLINYDSFFDFSFFSHLTLLTIMLKGKYYLSTKSD